MDTQQQPGLKVVVLGPGEGAAVHANATNEDLIHIKVSGEQSAGLLTVLEYNAVPHSEGVLPHIHEGHEEGFYVVEGELSMLVGHDRVVLQPGGWGFVPRGVLHAFWNDGDAPCKFVATFTPPGFEGIFFEREQLAARGFTREEMANLARKHGVMNMPWDKIDAYLAEHQEAAGER